MPLEYDNIKYIIWDVSKLHNISIYINLISIPLVCIHLY